MSVAALTELRSRLRLPGNVNPWVALGVGGGLLLLGGLVFRSLLLGAVGAVGVGLVARNVWKNRGGVLPWPKGPSSPETRGTQRSSPPRHSEPDDDAQEPPPQPSRRRVRPENEGDTIDRMVRARRYALLLHPEAASNLTENQHARASRALDEAMVVVPAGQVLVGVAAERETLGQDGAPDRMEGGVDAAVSVGPCYLDRYTVTNDEYQFFVDAGGYEELELWPEEALPALFDFVDATGAYAPRYWRQGRFPAGAEELPVVGISWYEAVAYARWVGKRLPDDAEWTKACAWPVEAAPGRIAQRRYPWGETFDNRRANIWSSGHGKPVAVGQYPEGATVGGAEQMIGNVWEWTRSTLDASTPSAIRFPSMLRTLRGGAYNTYFENQATCHFQSAEHPLARRPNIGVRLAIGMDAVVSSPVEA